MAAYKPTPRPKPGFFKPTAKEKAILTKRPLPKKTTPKLKERPVPGFFKQTAKEKAILTKVPLPKKSTPKPRQRPAR